MKFKKYPLWSLIAILVLTAFAPFATPSRPALVSPISKVVVTDPDAVTLKWTRSSPTSGETIDSYDVEISNGSAVNVDGSFVTTVDSSSVSAPDVTYLVGAGSLAYGTTYYWHVRSNDSASLTSAWSSLGTFRVGVQPPTLLPIADLLTLRPTFSWTPGAQNADNYTIQFSADPGFSKYTSATVTPTSNPVEYTPAADMLPNTNFYWRVRANNASLGYSAWAYPVPPDPFHTANPLTAPVLVSPKGTKIPPANVVLTWKPVALRGDITFVTYQVEIFDTNKDLDTVAPVFSANEADDASLALPETTKYTVPSTALQPATTYYWRVKAFSDNNVTAVNGEYSTSALFVFYTTIGGKIDAATMNPSATSGIGNVPGFEDPTIAVAAPRISGDTEDEYENHTLLSLYPTFKWDIAGTPTAETVTLWIADLGSGSCQLNDKKNESTFAKKIVEVTLPVGQTSYTANFEKYPGYVMCWKIRANHSVYGSSAWSDVQVFLVATPPSVPEILSPDDYALTDDNTPKFSWKQVTSKAPFWKYEIEISKGSFKDYLYTEPVAPYTEPVTAYPLMSPMDPTTAGGIPPAAPITTDTDPLADPEIRFPVILQASRVLKPDEVTRYANTISQPWYDIDDYPLEGNYTYHWRVRAYNMRGEYSAWSESRTLNIKPDRPINITLTDCAGTPVTAPTTPRPCFDWDDVYGAGKYVIQVARDPKYISIALNKEVVGSSYQPTIDLPRDKTLYWRVRARSASIYGYSLFSTPNGSFQSPNPPNTPTPVLPKRNQLSLTTEPTFKWRKPSVPLGTTFDYYEVQIANDKDFKFPVEDPPYQTTAGDINELEYTIGAGVLSHATTYYWRVRACNNASPNQCSSWSPVTYFRVAVGAPTLVTPPTYPTFEWDVVPDATGYTIYISKSDKCTAPVRAANISSSSYTVSKKLGDGDYYWCVRATKGGYGPGAWSLVDSFTLP